MVSVVVVDPDVVVVVVVVVGIVTRPTLGVCGGCGSRRVIDAIREKKQARRQGKSREEKRNRPSLRSGGGAPPGTTGPNHRLRKPVGAVTCLAELSQDGQ